MQSTESIFFQDSYPYQNLEQYKDICWHNAINQYFNQNDHQKQNKVNDHISSKNNDDDNTGLFTQIQFYNVSFDFLDQQKTLNQMESSVICLQQKSKESKETKKKVTKSKKLLKQKTYNTADYIIKQCFKALLSKDYISQVSQYCKQQKVSYEGLNNFLKKGLLKNKGKHIGINNFYKFIIIDDVFVTITKKFLLKYLWNDYSYYVLSGSMQNKHEYLQCATKLMYITKLNNHEGQSLGNVHN